jgi:hydroxysqualene synthase
MIASARFRSGKGARDENFPVASILIRDRHRPIIQAFYEFVRVADDIADHPHLSADVKLAHLDRLEASLIGNANDEPEGVVLGTKLRAANVSAQHAVEMLQAFRQDVGQRRYANWDELIAYCRLSAMPVGRFVLEVHGESRVTWRVSDALCAALQIINHLQDCKSDYRDLDRVYVPLDLLATEGAGVEELSVKSASAPLKRILTAVADRTAFLLEVSRPLPMLVHDKRLAMEISAIQALAGRMTAKLRSRDPLCDPVRLSRMSMATVGLRGALWGLFRRSLQKAPRLGRSHAQRPESQVH